MNASAGADVEASVAGEEGPDELEAATTGGTVVVAEQGDVVVVVDVSPVVDVVSAVPVVDVVLGDVVVVGSPVVAVVARISWGVGDVVVVEVVVVVVGPVVDEVLVLGAGAVVVVLVEVPVVQSVVVVVPAWSGVVEGVAAVVDVDGIVDVPVAEVEVVVSAATASGAAAQHGLTPVPASVLPGPATLDIGLAPAPVVKPTDKLVAMATVLMSAMSTRAPPTDRCRRVVRRTDPPDTDPCGTGAPAWCGHSHS